MPPKKQIRKDESAATGLPAQVASPPAPATSQRARTARGARDAAASSSDSSDDSSSSCSDSSDSTTPSEFIERNTAPGALPANPKPKAGAKPAGKLSPMAIVVATNQVIATRSPSDVKSKEEVLRAWLPRLPDGILLERSPDQPWPDEIIQNVAKQNVRQGAKAIDITSRCAVVKCKQCNSVLLLTSEQAFRNHRSTTRCQPAGAVEVASTPSPGVALSTNTVNDRSGTAETPSVGTPLATPRSALEAEYSLSRVRMPPVHNISARSLWGYDVVSTVCNSGQSVLATADMLVNSPLAAYISAKELPHALTLKGEMEREELSTDSTNVAKRLSALMSREFESDKMLIKNRLTDADLVVSFDGGFSKVLRCYILVIVVYCDGPIVLRPEISPGGTTLTGDQIMNLFSRAMREYGLELANIKIHVSDECSANKVCVAAIEAYQAIMAAASDIIATDRLSISSDEKLCLDRRQILEAVDTYLNSNKRITRVYCNFHNMSNAAQAARVAAKFEDTSAYKLIMKLNQMVFNSPAREERLVSFLSEKKSFTLSSSAGVVEELRGKIARYGSSAGQWEILVDLINNARAKVNLGLIGGKSGLEEMNLAVDELARLFNNAKAPSGMVKVGDTRKIRTSRTCYEWTQRHIGSLVEFMEGERTMCASMKEALALLKGPGAIVRIHWELEVYLTCFHDFNVVLDAISDYNRHSGPQFYMTFKRLMDELQKRLVQLRNRSLDEMKDIPPELGDDMLTLAFNLTSNLIGELQKRINGSMNDRGINISFWHFVTSLNPDCLVSRERDWFPKDAVLKSLWSDKDLHDQWNEYVISDATLTGQTTPRQFWARSETKARYPVLARLALVCLDTPVSVSLCDQVLSVEKHLFTQQQRRMGCELWSGMVCHRANATFGDPNVLEHSM